MTPAVDTLEQLGLGYRLLNYKTRNVSDLAATVADELGLEREQVFKTLVTASDNQLFVAVVPSELTLDLKKLAKVAGVKKVRMAEQSAAERSSGYLKGAISPIGQKHRLRTFVDTSASEFDVIYVSAGKRGVELELTVQDLLVACDGSLCELT